MAIQDIAKKNPAFRYQLYLGWESDNAAQELDNDTERMIRAVFRTSQKSEHIGYVCHCILYVAQIYHETSTLTLYKYIVNG